MPNLLYFRRIFFDKLQLLLCIVSVILVFGILAWILVTLFMRGLLALRFSLLTKVTLPPMQHGGLANAIIGSVLMVSIAMIMAIPLGIFAGIYLSEYTNFRPRFAKAVHFFNDILLSTPSIIIGLFVYQIVVVTMGSFSGWAGSLALMLIAFPMIVRTTEDICRLVPSTLREAAMALGISQWRIILTLVLRVTKSGVIAGILLALARISGETAPLLFTALNNKFWSFNLSHPMANLPSTIFDYVLSPYPEWQQIAWAGALMITIWILTINITVRITANYRR
jgi:phosphate transport system permease protein